MGFMDQFRQTQPQQIQQPDIIGLANRARQIGGSDPLAAVKQMADSGVTCNLPNGRMMSVKDMLSLAQGKTTRQFLMDLGL